MAQWAWIFICNIALAYAEMELLVETPDGEERLNGYQSHQMLYTKIEEAIGKKMQWAAQNLIKDTNLQPIHFLTNIDDGEYGILQLAYSLSNNDFAFSKVIIGLLSRDEADRGVSGSKIECLIEKSPIKLPTDKMYNAVDALANADKNGLGNVSKQTKEGLLAVMNVKAILNEASNKGNQKLVQWLLNICDDLQTDEAIETAWRQKHWGIVKLFISSGKIMNKKTLINRNNSNNGTLLHLVVESGNIEYLKEILDQGADVNVYDVNELTPLHKVVTAGDLNAAKLLLKKGADPNSATLSGNTPLHAAVVNGNLNIVKLLVESGSKMDVNNKQGLNPVALAEEYSLNGIMHYFLLNNVTFPKDTNNDLKLRYKLNSIINGENNSCIHLSQFPIPYSEIAQFFYSKDANSSITSEFSNKLLELVVESNVEEPLQAVLNLGANIRTVKKNMQSLLFKAVRSRNTNFVNLLLKQSILDVNAKDINERTALHLAASIGNVDIINSLLRYGADIHARTMDKMTVLHLAAKEGNPAVKFFIQKGLDINAVNRNDETPLYLAAREGYNDIVALLVANGAYTYSKDVNGNAPIHAAAFKGQTPVVKYLLDNGIDINVLNYRNESAAYLASLTGQIETVQLLVKGGADLYLRNIDYWMTLHVSAREGHPSVVNILLNAGVDINLQNGRQETALYLASMDGRTDVVKLLLDRNANKTIPNIDGWTCLHVAAGEGRYETVDLLLKSGMDTEVVNYRKETPLYVASLRGKAKVVELLLSRGANKVTRNQDNWTPIHTAALEGHPEVVQALLKSGVDVNILNGNKETPLHLASIRGHEKVIKVLIDMGAKRPA